jgi:undecaprenyl-diphosphatase
MPNLDIRFFKYWRKHSFSPKIDRFLRIYTRLGDGYVWVLVIAFIYFFYEIDILLGLVKHAIPVIFVSLALYWIVKLSVRRKRPFDLFKSVSAEVPPLDKYSFPSGHTMNNLAVGFLILTEIPEIGWIVVFMPITWGLLRVYYGVHWLSDVIAGIFLGFFSYLLGKIIYLLW